MKRDRSPRLLVLGLSALLLMLAPGCEAGKKNGHYKIEQQQPARFITPERSAADSVRYDEAACPAMPAATGAFAYLQAITIPENRRTGTQGYRCAEAFVKQTLVSMGYDVHEVVYHFPYYDFDPAAVKVTRVSDGRDFPAFPMYMSAATDGPVTGKVCRPRRDLTGCLVYTDPEEPWTGDIREQYETWKKAGALGIIRAATIKPLATRNLRHATFAHATSWHYAPLPGFVVEHARELLGQTVTVNNPARIVEGTGYTVAAQDPRPAEKYVVATAHLDGWFSAALDDGTGSAALLEAARQMKDDARGVIFLFADSEEPGLIGSAAFVQDFDLQRVSSIVELDMVSTRYNYGHRHTPETTTIMPRFISVTPGAKRATKPSLRGLPGHNFFVPIDFVAKFFGGIATDMNWFYYAGVPGSFIYTPSKYYHTERDTIEWIAPDDLQAVADKTVDLIRAYRNQPPPAPKPVIPIDFRVEPGQGDTVEFRVKLDPPPLTADIVVRSYFEMGIEGKTVLEKAKDGDWTGEFRPPFPGDWRYLVTVIAGGKSGKQWGKLPVEKKIVPEGR